MAVFAFVKPNGEISETHAPAPIAAPSYVEGEFVGECVIKQVPTEIEAQFDLSLWVYDFNTSSFIEREAQPSSYHVWSNGEWVIDQDKFWPMLRRIRTRKLFDCDWTQMPDVNISYEERMKWSLYRQQLREFPNMLSELDLIENLPWPIDPNHPDFDTVNGPMFSDPNLLAE